MPVPPPQRSGGSSWPPPLFSFEEAIAQQLAQQEEAIVDAMLVSLARHRLAPDAWGRLHAAARRDGRIDEVAAAFATVSCSPRMKTLQPPEAAEFLFEAARFFDDVVGDDLGAAMYLERSLALAPAHAESFAKMETILERRSSPGKHLAELYVAVAPHRPRGQQALLLRRAAELFTRSGQGAADEASVDDVDDVDDRVVDLWQQIGRLEPGDDGARSRLEALYLKAGRFRDAVRLNEQSLDRDPRPDEHVRELLLERVVELYAERLDEPERAIAPFEQLLSINPAHEGARRVGERLLLVKGLAGRAAAALATAFEAHGTPEQVARCLTLELESSHGARRAHLLTRLGRLRSEPMGDDAGALEAYDMALALDPTDPELRSLYVELATRVGRHVDAVKILERTALAAREPAFKTRVSVELGEVLLRQGDMKRARAVLSEVFVSWRPPADAELRAARGLRAIYEASYDRKALCDVLDRLRDLEKDEEGRREANERLAAVAMKLNDKPRAIEAYRRLLSTPARAGALEALARLYGASGERENYARVLESQAIDAGDAKKARGLMVRAAEVRAKQLDDPAGAIATYRALLERYGPDGDTHSRLEELYVKTERWSELRAFLVDRLREAGPDEAREIREKLARLTARPPAH
jgi:tetratricopeptide (TPR) repeat protein